MSPAGTQPVRIAAFMTTGLNQSAKSSTSTIIAQAWRAIKSDAGKLTLGTISALASYFASIDYSVTNSTTSLTVLSLGALITMAMVAATFNKKGGAK